MSTVNVPTHTNQTIIIIISQGGASFFLSPGNGSSRLIRSAPMDADVCSHRQLSQYPNR